MNNSISIDQKTISSRIIASLIRNQHRFWAFSGLIVLMIFFSLASPNFFQTTNLISILQATSVNGVLAIAATLAIITAGIDLSVGTLMTFCAVIAGVLLTNMGLPMYIGIPGALLSGFICGAISGVFVAKFNIPPFIATLGMMLVYKGLALAISSGRPIYFNDTEGFNEIASGSIIGHIIPAFPIPNGVLILFIVAILTSYILSKTILGRFIFALGSNEEALRLSGINVDRWKIMVYSLAGGICAVAGILLASRINSAQPAIGQGYELDAIAAVVIGGTSLAGGKGTILGTLIGALIISVVANGLRILSVPQEWQIVVTGIIILLAVFTDQLRQKK